MFCRSAGTGGGAVMLKRPEPMVPVVELAATSITFGDASPVEAAPGPLLPAEWDTNTPASQAASRATATPSAQGITPL